MSTERALPNWVRTRRIVRQLHRWLGLLVGIQVLLWVTGGLVMSWLKLEEVRGEASIAERPATALDAGDPLVAVNAIIGQAAEPVTAITLTALLGKPVYRIAFAKGHSLVDARSGQTLAPLPEEMARQVAVADYGGSGTLQGMDWVEEPALEYRERDLPLWRARFDDERDTTLYISPQTGLIVARRNDLWRLFDFFWMLHIMDYEEREDFNHPLLVTTAATALLFVFTGLAMLVFSFRRRPT